MFTVPAATPVTTPDDTSTVAMLPSPDCQVPPPTPLVSVVAPPSHTASVPPMPDSALTLTSIEAEQPVLNV
jgi:hypothetical protein